MHPDTTTWRSGGARGGRGGARGGRGGRGGARGSWRNGGVARSGGEARPCWRDGLSVAEQAKVMFERDCVDGALNGPIPFGLIPRYYDLPEHASRRFHPLLPKIQTVESTSVSASSPAYLMQEARFMRAMMQQLGGNTKVIIDATAHVGVISQVLLRLFPEARLEAVEFVRETSEVLAANLAAAQLADRAQVTNACAVRYLRKERDPEVDLVYFDPPWGGSGCYQEATPEDFSLSGVPLAVLIRDALKISRCVVAKYRPEMALERIKRRVGARCLGVAEITRQKRGYAKTLYTLLAFVSD